MKPLNEQKHINEDVPLNDERDWQDDFYSTLDKMGLNEFDATSSIAELALRMSMNGFSREDRDLSEGDIWYGLVTWYSHLCIKSVLNHININVFYGCGQNTQSKAKNNFSTDEAEEAAKAMWKIGCDIHNKKSACIQVIFNCIKEFVALDQPSKDKVFGFLDRVKGSYSDIDMFSEKFVQKLTKASIPENDIPEA